MSQKSINFYPIAAHAASLAFYFYIAGKSQGNVSKVSVVAAAALQAGHSHQNQDPKKNTLCKYSFVVISAGCLLGNTGVKIWGTSLGYFGTSFYVIHSHIPKAKIDLPPPPENTPQAISNLLFSKTPQKKDRGQFKNPEGVTVAPRDPNARSPSTRTKPRGGSGAPSGRNGVSGGLSKGVGPTGLRGIPNISSNCFLIATYQLLKHNPPLYDALFASNAFKEDRRLDTFRTFDALYDSGKQLWKQDMHTVRTDCLTKFNIPRYGHQDAYEALVAIAGNLPLTSSLDSEGIYEFTVPASEEEATLREIENIETVKREAIAGDQVTFHVKKRFPKERMSSHSVSLTGITSGTQLETIIAADLSEGEGTDDNLYDLSPTVKGRQIKKDSALHAGKEILIVLKRFEKRSKNALIRDYEKISTPISVPNGKVQLVEGKEAHTVKGFIVHSGTYSGGHYVEYQKIDKQWYLNNDGSSTKISTGTALAAMGKAYILYAEQPQT